MSTHHWSCDPDTYTLFRNIVDKLKRLEDTRGTDDPEYAYWADTLKGLQGFPRGADPLHDTIEIHRTQSSGRILSAPNWQR